jgi:hypothetical protein
MATEFRRFFTEKQITFGTRLLNGENKFARAILDWCMQNSVALRSRTDEWVMATYEQLVVDPLPLIQQIVERLELPEPNRIISRLKVPSQSTALSDKDTRQVLGTSRNYNQQQWLVEKWRESITDHDLMLAAEILETFGLDRIYSVSDSRPNAAYWVS